MQLFSLKYFFNDQGECVVRANGPDTIIPRPYKSLTLLVWSTNYKKLSPWQGGHIYIMWRASGGFGKINQEIPITSRVSSNHDSFTILCQWKLHELNRQCPWSQQDVRFSLLSTLSRNVRQIILKTTQNSLCPQEKDNKLCMISMT